MSVFKLFLIFVKIGAILLGGGYVILPLMNNEFTEKRKILSSDDLLSYFAISQSIPGIIAANMSMFIGYKIKGKIGALAAIAGITFVPFWIIIALASIIDLLVNNIYMKSAFWGIGIAVIALICLTVREMWQKSEKNIFFYLIFFGSLFAILIFKYTPIQTILLFTILGLIAKVYIKRRKHQI